VSPFRDVKSSLAACALAAVGAAVVVLSAILVIAPAPARADTGFQPWWVQSFEVTHLWSGPADPAVDYGEIPQWTYLLVVAPQNGPRLFVFVPATGNYAYVDARSVGPSGPPPTPTASPTPTSTPSTTAVTTPSATPSTPAPTTTPVSGQSTTSWVQSRRPSDLWSGPDDKAVDYGPLPVGSYLQPVAPPNGTRLFVYVPWTRNYAYVDAAAVVPSAPPPPGVTASDDWEWTGRVIDPGSLWERSAPTQKAPVVKTLPPGTVVHVVAWVEGQEIVPGTWTWGQLPDGNYFYANSVQIIPPTTPPPPPANHPSGKWIDVNTLRQVAVAYQDTTPVYMAVVSSGSPGWETPTGVHTIWRRVPSETMVGSTLSSLGLDAEQLARAHYDLKNVLYTQYFDGFGDALHDNYWLAPWQFGVPRSHGCVGMPEADALWFWNWATTGTAVVVHSG
jgi:hypothetical protein